MFVRHHDLERVDNFTKGNGFVLSPTFHILWRLDKDYKTVCLAFEVDFGDETVVPRHQSEGRNKILVQCKKCKGCDHICTKRLSWVL